MQGIVVGVRRGVSCRGLWWGCGGAFDAGACGGGARGRVMQGIVVEVRGGVS